MNTDKNPLSQADDQLLDEAEKLIWALLDERLEDADSERLEKLIRENEQVRSRYLQISQLHSSLYEHYGKGAQPAEKSPVLTFLGDFSTTPHDHSPLSD
ncbi:MAG: hypothetical protein GXP26_02880 [Planctomycetes bacterium]|nr:hypothetical protein [Planctomycetota bacterium]